MGLETASIGQMHVHRTYFLSKTHKNSSEGGQKSMLNVTNHGVCTVVCCPGDVDFVSGIDGVFAEAPCFILGLRRHNVASPDAYAGPRHSTASSRTNIINKRGV